MAAYLTRVRDAYVRTPCSGIMLSSTVVIVLFTVLLVGGTDAKLFGDIMKKIDQGVGFVNSVKEFFGEKGEVSQN